VIVAIVVSRQRYVRFGGSGTLFERVAIWTVVIGFLGARAAYVSTHLSRFSGRPWAVLFIWEGGLALYGGLVAGALTMIFLVQRYHGDVFAIGDAIAVGLPLAQAIGRLGNYFNQELFGTPSDLPWAIIIDPANRPAEYAQYATFHPTSWGVYVTMYAFIRFLMELIRTDTTFRFIGLSRNAWVSVVAMLFGVAWIVYTQRRAEKRTLVGHPTFFSLQPATEPVPDMGSPDAEADDEPSN
jgi:prolipoprotein diacylglyceryltransferase